VLAAVVRLDMEIVPSGDEMSIKEVGSSLAGFRV